MACSEIFNSVKIKELQLKHKEDTFSFVLELIKRFSSKMINQKLKD